MKRSQRFVAAFLLVAAILGGAVGVQPAATAAAQSTALESHSAPQTLDLIRRWVIGEYDNRAQAERDLADDTIPDDLKHRLMHQLFVPVAVEVPSIPGYLVFQQSSIDGSNDPETIVRAGLLQYIVDEDGVVHQRELNFKELARFKNAHRNQALFRTLTMEQFAVDPACDFLIEQAQDGQSISGPMRTGACRIFSPGIGKQLIADDAITIRENEYWFLGRFVDETGRVMWGNASAEPVKLIHVPKN